MVDREGLERAVVLLDAGGVVAMPTETVYGLAARVDRPDAVRRLFELKSRPLFDPLIVHVASAAQARRVTRIWPRAAARLAEAFWPGPLTLVLPKADSVDPLMTAGLDTVGVRMPRHEAALALIEQAGPVAAPSANRFGRTSPTSPSHVRAEFPESELLILDGGSCEVGVESTVARVSEGVGGVMVEVLRPGEVTAGAIETALEALGDPAQVIRASDDAKRASPGHMERHYQPDAPVALLTSELALDEAIERARVALGAGRGEAAVLTLDADARIAARTLYADLRRLAGSAPALIVVRLGPERSGDAWEAVRDRLQRAAGVTL